jgi:hypothetical protein
MQLRVARLCVDCEEIHDSQRCPVCASETFAYISRWVPAPERRTNPNSRPAAPPSRSNSRLVGYGVLGVGIAGLARWWWKTRADVEAAALRGAGELK